ncbi:MAG: ATP-binding cassette domain-containing protein, partial [Ancrocorticia sp.]
MPVISTHDLDVILGSSRILHRVSLNIHEGETVAILGANGSGKSTLIRTIMGVIPPSGGTASVFGTNITHHSRVPWDRLGYVPQRVAAASGVPATALEVVRSGLLGPKALWADRGKKAKRAALEALSAVGLADRANEHVHVF